MNLYQTISEAISAGKSVRVLTSLQNTAVFSIGEKSCVCDGVRTDSVPAHAQAWQAHYAALASGCLCADAVLAEHLLPKPALILLGGGHVSLALAEVCARLDFSVTVVDDRPEFACAARFPMAEHVLCMPFAAAFEQLPRAENTYYAIMTRGHQDDTACLSLALQRPFAYVGMIGSRRKNAMVKELLEKQGIPKSLLAQVYAPIGKAIGAQTPAEIAISIAAQLIDVRHAHGGGAVLEPNVCAALCVSGAVAITILGKHGSAPRGTGTRMVLLPNGTAVGTIGGGAAEFEAIQIAQKMIADAADKAQILTFSMSNTDAAGSGMICGGEVTVLLERIAAN
ncbi:MAG: XdhC/CoxI family protein [Ruthenibacterium sp.]